MAITSGFFNSIDGDRTYNAEEMTTYFDGLVSDGVYENIGDRFLVSENAGMTVKVGTGRAIILSRWVKNDAQTVLNIDPADVQFGRIDAVTLRLDLDNRFISLYVKKGTPSSSPSIPEITRNDIVYELFLAAVYVAKNATTPTLITDLRPSIYCGWVTGIIQQVNTADLFDQWNRAYEKQYAEFDAYMNEKMQQFNEWFNSLTRQLIVQTGVTKYEAKNRLPAGVTGCIINIQEYDNEKDVLLVFADGLYCCEGVDYHIATFLDLKLVKFYSASSSQRQLTFVCLKNVVGQNVIGVGDSGLSTAVMSGSAQYVVGEAIYD